MPDAGLFSGIPNLGASVGGVLSPDISVTSLPTGFDAVMQCDSVLLQTVLSENLAQAGASPLSAQVPYAADLFPAPVRDAVAPQIRPIDSALGVESFIELRLTTPVLTGLSAGYEPPADAVVVSTGTSAMARTVPGALQGPPLEITWSVELNYVRISPLSGPVLTASDTSGNGGITHRGGPSAAAGVIASGIFTAGATMGTSGTSDNSRNESRVLLASGQAVTQMPAAIATRPELLQMWLEMDVAHTTVSFTTDDIMLTALLNAPIGQSMVPSALASLTRQPALRASPLFALPGVMTQAQVQTLGLTGMRVVHAVHRLPNERQVLSLAATFGPDSHGSAAQLQPFLAPRHFASFVSLRVLTPIFRERWRLNPASRDYIGDVPVTMPLNAGSDDTGQGKARLHVTISETLSSATLAPFVSENGDVLQLGCDETIQLLRAWYANGDEVGDLGDLGKPVTMPFVANTAPFTPAPADEPLDSPFRTFLRYVLEPLAYPMLERFDLATIDGFASAALGAVLTRWSLHIARPQEGIAVTGGANTMAN